MVTKSTRFVITALFASAMFAQAPASQPTDRVLHLTQAATDRELQEIATNIRGITEIPQVSIDASQNTLTLHGTAAQIALADWLFNQWENSAPQADNPAGHEYSLSSDDIVQVFHLAHAPTPQILQEIATNVRAIGNIRHLFTYSTSSIITARGDASQIALAEWLVSQLDQPANQAVRTAAPHEYHPAAATDDVVRVFYPAHTGMEQGLQEMTTDVRTIANIRLLFFYRESTAIVARAPAADIALAEWLVNELDQPPNQPPRTPAPHEYHPSGTVDLVVHVFFLTHGPPRLQQIATKVRSTSEVTRIFTYSPSQALVMRGTAAQVALASRLIAEQDR